MSGYKSGRQIPWMKRRVVKDLTAWRRHKLLRAAQTAAARGWRWPALCSPHPEWSLQLPLQLKDNTPVKRFTPKARRQQKDRIQPRTSREWQTQVNAATLKHKHLDGGMCTVTRAGRCLLTQAQETQGGEVLFILWTCWRKKSCVDCSSPAEHTTQHTRTDSPSRAWLPKQSWAAARNHSVSHGIWTERSHFLRSCNC